MQQTMHKKNPGELDEKLITKNFNLSWTNFLLINGTDRLSKCSNMKFIVYEIEERNVESY
jgi:hypothetical protein